VSLFVPGKLNAGNIDLDHKSGHPSLDPDLAPNITSILCIAT